MSEYGYAGKILTIDLPEGTARELPTSDYAAKYIGGRGFTARIFWDMVPAKVSSDDAENCLICATGPVSGFTGLAGARWVMGTVTPLRQPNAFSYGNLGGRWGSALKAGGYDALAIKGKAEAPAYLHINNGQVELKDASDLWGLSTFDTTDSIKAELGKNVSVLAIGPAAENGVVFATALADNSASVSGGIGSVMGAKKLKAIVVTGSGQPKAAEPEKLQEIRDFVKQVRSSTFDGMSPWAIPGVTIPENCSGCGIGCSRQSYKADDGRRYKLFCQASGIYNMAAMDYYKKPNDAGLLAVRLDDGYGFDAAVMAPMISWLSECHREGVITEEQTGLTLSEMGSVEFIRELTRKIAFREGFGDVLAQGTLTAAQTLGDKALALANKYLATPSSETRDYDPRMLLTTAIMLATEPRRPITQLHGFSGNVWISWVNWARRMESAFLTTDDFREIARRFWGGEQAVDFSTYRGKALAAKKVQNRVSVNESMILCDVHWPMMVTSADHSEGHVGDPALESRIYSAITGQQTDEDELNQKGERIYNLVRAIQMRQGWGGRKGDKILDYFHTQPLKQGDVFFDTDGIMPGPDGNIISRLGEVLDRDEFDEMMCEYYILRGWDSDTGFQTNEQLAGLGLEDVAGDLSRLNLTV